LGGRKGIWPVKNQLVGCWHGYLSERGADLHMTQLMPLPLTISFFGKIQIGSGVGLGTMGTRGVHCTPQVQDLYPQVKDAAYVKILSKRL